MPFFHRFYARFTLIPSCYTIRTFPPSTYPLFWALCRVLKTKKGEEDSVFYFLSNEPGIGLIFFYILGSLWPFFHFFLYFLIIRISQFLQVHNFHTVSDPDVRDCIRTVSFSYRCGKPNNNFLPARSTAWTWWIDLRTHSNKTFQ
jgi:hypothetical protein